MQTEYPAYLLPAEEAREHAELKPEFSDTPPEQGAGADPEAPWGRKADGSPKAKPGRPSGTPDSRPRTRTTQRRARVAAAPPRRKAAPKATRQAGPDYRPGIVGILQLLSAPLAVAGIKSPPLALDAAALALHAEPLAQAMQDTAEQVPPFAAVLDKILTVGPYGALLAAAMPLAVQVMANHGILPGQVAQSMGAMAPDELMAQIQPETAA